MKKNLLPLALLALFALSASVSIHTPAYADDSALQQLNDEAGSSSAAASAPSDEQAASEASQGFDTAQPPVVDTRTPSEGSSGLDNAPTYNDNSGSGLDNAPTPPQE